MTAISSRLGGLAFLMLMLFVVPGRAEPSGAELYARSCAQCHDSADPALRAPRREVMRTMSPEAIVHALESGSMKPFGQDFRPTSGWRSPRPSRTSPPI